jgi:ribonuclease HI
VHFAPLTAFRRVDGEFVAHSETFAPLTNENRVSGDLCTLRAPLNAAVHVRTSRRPALYHRAPMPRPDTPVETRNGEALVWTDGACSGNPGPGGWAAIVVPANGGEPVELSGGEGHTTNNRMEYTAALEGLKALPSGSRACIVTDSRLMLESMTKWIAGWKRRGWKTAAGDPVKNQDLVRALEAEIGRHAAVRWHWVRGHETGAAHAHKALNDRADRLAVAASRAVA